ncbi:DUF397 domain-containing protein [Streptomyces sp. NBC_00239]|uniref:DUF397 domain-containing protein n=1 Tax=Streptomyces sp. NBC_00239 TaxID=2903640 RepID=UPI002E2A2563|nr:DUF397 domain-containing protein [Streptomyces sp. NBC_00239]
MTMILSAVTSGLSWTKSSYSGDGGNCVEVAAGQLVGVTPVRDSKVPAGPALAFSEPEWGVFVDAVKAGQL